MNYNGVLVYCVIIFSALILVNCASTTQVSKLSSEIEDVNSKLNQINNNIDILRPEIEHAKNEATRANKRLDNQISFYKK